jgi:hypothetical protein
MAIETPQAYFTGNGPMTALGAHAAEFRALPADVGSLRDVVQGVLIHRDMAPFLYDLKLSNEKRDEANTRPMAEMLARIHALDEHPVTVAREPGRRLPCVCRHFSVMLTSMLQSRKVPARARCGFGAYFNAGKFEDHWVCEYWNAAQKRWVLVDAQLDAIQRKTFRVGFDPLDVPRTSFIIAGDAWQMCRSGRADPANFGLSMVPGLKGWWFIAGNVLRDLASLNRMEMLPWDVWGAMDQSDASYVGEKAALIDRVAALTLAGDDAFPEVRAIYESDDRLRVPPVVLNVDRNAQEKIAP